MDFKLTDDLDLFLDENILTTQEDGETTLIQAFFTDARIDERRGYWLDIQKSDMWQYDQKRLTQETANDLNESARAIADELVENVKLYDRIETDAFIERNELFLHITAYNNKNISIDRKFKI